MDTLASNMKPKTQSVPSSATKEENVSEIDGISSTKPIPRDEPSKPITKKKE